MAESTAKVVIPTYKQVRAARELLGWTQDDLAAKAGVARSTLQGFEQGKMKPHHSTLEKIREACALRGIVFTNGDNPTVSLQRDKATLPV